MLRHSNHPSIQDRTGTARELQAGDDTIVLIVEDHSDLRDFMRDYLQPDYKIIEAATGSDGLDMAKAAIPDLVISDIMMPEMSGYDLCRALKADEATSHIPVILLTAKAAVDDKLEGLETGADDYLTKPFDQKELKLRVRNLIQTRRHLRDKFSSEMLLKPGEITVPSSQRLFLERVMQTVEKHLDDEDFGVETLAAEIGLSRAQVLRKLRALTNQTPSQLIRSFRLQRAAELIKQNAGTIAEIAYRVGFSSQQYFTNCFTEEFGCPPSEFRKRAERAEPKNPPIEESH